jgi:Skp family chaperone for outer membrane proteins
MRQVVEQGRQASAMLNGMTQSAYQNTSHRFAALQQLINRIGTAQDPKAIQDLQARIQSEQTMLTNEQTKLQSLYQIVQSDELARRQRIRERSAADIGSARSLSVVDY